MTPTPEQVLAAVTAVTGFTRAVLRHPHSQRGLPAARRAAIHLMQRRCGLRRGEISQAMGHMSPNNVDTALAKAGEELRESAVFRDLVARVAARLPGGRAPPPREDPRKLPRVRNCLMCRAFFESSDAGNRVCIRCKATSAWKSGGDCTVYPG